MSRAPSRANEPTAYDDLNELLGEFVDGVRDALAQDFVGAYLVGSFALGAGDEWSDADFVVVAEREPDPAPLNVLHGDLFARDNRWARHLEGSYLPRELIRRVDPSRTKVWFLDHGSSALVCDDHCNTAVVRWVLHRHGITLAGPGPRSLVDAVDPDDLRAEARTFLREYVEWSRTQPMNRWLEPYLVLTLCRLHATLDRGAVLSKSDAGAWGLEQLDSEWHDLITAALADRPDPVGRWFTPSTPEAEARTRAFVEAHA